MGRGYRQEFSFPLSTLSSLCTPFQLVVFALPRESRKKKKHTLRSCTSKWSQRVTFLSCAQFRPVVMWNSLVTAVSLAWRLRIHMLCRDIAEFSLSAVPRDIQVILRTLMYYDAPEQSFFFFLSFPTFGLAS